MALERSGTQLGPFATPRDESRIAPLLPIAERELERALLEQLRPSLGMYVHTSSAEHAAVERAVHVICGEARRFGLRAEEMIIGVKQSWARLAHVRARQLGDRDADVLCEVVSRSIEVFHEAQDASPHKLQA
jgi:hypothetical protein